MIFADKLIKLRKQSGWSQEELAERLDVTRQSISKWEGAQSVPDLERMLKLSELFGVSLDYLLKDEIEDIEPTADPPATPVRRVTMEEANAFLAVKEATARPVALGVVLCILSPICLFILGALAQPEMGPLLTENLAAGVGLLTLFAMVIGAVALFLLSGAKASPYEFLETEIFETEYGVTGMVRERQNQYRAAHTHLTTAGVLLCVAAPIPLFCLLFIPETAFLTAAILLSATLLLVAAGVFLLVDSGIRWESCQKLLQEGDYTKERKAHQGLTTAVTLTYWMTALAVYLAWSLLTGQWEITWLVWAIAGVLFPVVYKLLEYFTRKR